MRSYYLTVLALDDSATDSDIRAAYRRLSKMYHPDRNPAPDANEKFIEIKKAYEYLKSGDQQMEDFQVEEPLSDIELWRAQAKQRARERAREQERYKQEVLGKIVSILQPIVAGILLFNTLLAIDYLLPRKNADQQLQEIEKIWVSAGRSSRLVYTYDDFHFDDYVMRFPKRSILLVKPGERMEVQATPIMAKPLKLVINKDGQIHEFFQLYNVFVVFGYLIPALLGFSLAFFLLKTPINKINMAVVLVVLQPVQLVVFFMF